MANAQYLEMLLNRRKVRSSLVEWSTFRHPEKPPQKHHKLLLDVLEALIDNKLTHPTTGKPCHNLIVKMPTGAGKSTYTSVDMPPYYLCRYPNHGFLACSHNKDLVQSFSRQCRNTINLHSATLGYSLSPDSHAVDEWRTTRNGFYFCAGVATGIAGHRANFGLVDDYIGTEEDAQSKQSRDKIWDWYENDYYPRLTNDDVTGAHFKQAVIATPRHEDDLIGRLLEKEPQDWYVYKIPFFPCENDPLGRPYSQTMSIEERVSNRLWPEHFTAEDAYKILTRSPRTVSCLYQLEPVPESGDFFRAEWFKPYHSLSDLPGESRTYGAGDFAISVAKGANATCFGFVNIDSEGDLWLRPELFWESCGPKKLVANWLRLLEMFHPITFWAEKGHISKSIGPFLKEMMLEEKIFVNIEEVTPVKDKETRAQTLRGLAEMGKVHVPVFAPWWPEALHELTTFPNGKTDDFVDMLAHIGMGIRRMGRATKVEEKVVPSLNQPWRPTLAWVMSHDVSKKLVDSYNDR